MPIVINTTNRIAKKIALGPPTGSSVRRIDSSGAIVPITEIRKQPTPTHATTADTVDSKRVLCTDPMMPTKIVAGIAMRPQRYISRINIESRLRTQAINTVKRSKAASNRTRVVLFATAATHFGQASRRVGKVIIYRVVNHAPRFKIGRRRFREWKILPEPLPKGDQWILSLRPVRPANNGQPVLDFSIL